MSSFASKVVAFGVIGPPQGVSVSKVVAYVVLDPGSESGVTPPTSQSYTYGQRIRRQDD
jgi:hypothetical protein